MPGIWVIVAILFAGVGIIVAWPFLPVIQSFTNSSNEGLTVALNTTWASGTPLEPIMRLWPVWTIILIAICVVFIVVSMSRSNG